MRIQAINNTNFRGLFTDKSAQNGGDWKMEYSPYSWESDNTSKMSNKKHVDVFSSSLPDNEEIYIESLDGAKSSKDILGTESYYLKSNGKMRRTITEVPAMNREESLRVLNKKLDVFEKMKYQKAEEIQNEIVERRSDIGKSSSRFEEYYCDASSGLFVRNHSLTTSHDIMREEFQNVKRKELSLYDDFNKYVGLRDSIDNIAHQRYNNEKEIELLGDLRKSGDLIDISRRDVAEPNKALKDALKDLRTFYNKFVSLPHKTISARELARRFSADTGSFLSEQILEYVNTLIKRKL